MSRHTSSRNPAIRNMIKTDGEEATMEFVKNYYGIPSEVKDWKTIDMMAERKQMEMNNQAKAK